MKRRRQHIGALAAGALLAAALPACRADGGAADAEAAAAIEALLAGQTEAWNRGDLHAFVAGYAESEQRMTYVGSKGTLVRGRAALEQRYRASYPAGERGTLAFRDLDVRPVGRDAWIVFGRWTLERPPDHPHGVFTLVVERGPGGLEIVHDHSSGSE